MTTAPLRVQTERSTGAADRVVIVGWEEGASRERPLTMTPIVSSKGQNLPVSR